MDDSIAYKLLVPYRLSYLIRKYAPVVYTKAAENERKPVVVDTEVGKLFVPQPLPKQSPLLPAKVLTAPFNKLQRILGGPNPLTLSLLLGTIMAGLGGAGGWLAKKIAPNKFGGLITKRLAILSGLVGALPGLALGLIQTPKKGLRKAFTDPWPNEPDLSPPVEISLVDPILRPLDIDKEEKIGATSTLSFAVSPFVPSIYEPAWRQVVFEDPFLTNKEAALMAGLPFGASVATGNLLISPTDIATVSANAGLGSFLGHRIGRIASAILASPPDTRKFLQESGTIAQVIRNAAGYS